MKFFPFKGRCLLIWIGFACCLLSFFLKEVHALIEEIETTPSNSNGVEIGELSVLQYVLFMLFFLKLTLLYAAGVLPLEIDLGGYWNLLFRYDNTTDPSNLFLIGRSLRSKRDAEWLQETDSYSFVWDCSLQLLCDIDHWAKETHDSPLDHFVAYWLRNDKIRWSSPNAVNYGGYGTCEEMYPCPFNMQEAVGIHVPNSGKKRVSEDDDKYFSLSLPEYEVSQY